MPKFNLELSKNLILNFAYIHSKHSKLGMFIFFQKNQFVYRNNVNSPPIRQFPSFSISGHVHDKAQENLKIYFWGNFHFVLGLLARDIANYSYAQITSFSQLGLKPLEFFFSATQTQFSHVCLSSC